MTGLEGFILGIYVGIRRARGDAEIAHNTSINPRRAQKGIFAAKSILRDTHLLEEN